MDLTPLLYKPAFYTYQFDIYYIQITLIAFFKPYFIGLP